MADVLDVETQIVSIINTILYPSGSPPSALAAIPVKIYPGWPDKVDLDADLAPGGGGLPAAVHITVTSIPTAERNTTRYPTEWQDAVINPLTYTIVGAGQTITIGGAAPNPYYPQNFWAFVNGKPYGYQAQAGNTPSQVAAGLQAAIVAGVAGTTVAGAVVTLPATARMGSLRLGTTGTSIKEVGRQEKLFVITEWVDTPLRRRDLGQLVDPVLRDTPRFTLPDGFSARFTYHGQRDDDTDQKQGIYRRDYTYSVEFATTRSETDTQIEAFEEDVSDQNGTSIKTVYG